MKLKTGSLLVVALLLGAGDAEDAKKEVAKFAGTWSVSALKYNGEDVTNDAKLQFKFIFKGNEATVEGNEEVKKEYARLKFKLDPSVSPKIIDFTVALGIQKDAAIEGIYAIKGDELKICAKVFGKDRPTEFESPDGSSVVLMVLKRMAP